MTRDLNLRGVPYGIMHGVRPVKIIHRWLKDNFAVTNQGVIDRDKIARRLRAEYLTNYEKSLLLTEVALRQIPILNSSDEKTISVYIGIPFCVTRCLYCSFPSNVLPSDEKVAEFMEVLTRDIDAAKIEIERYGFKVQNIYIGGGTPSSLPINFFRELLEKVTTAFYGDATKEFTVECGRPDTVDDEKISAMKDFHVNRVCLNPQTMQQKTLDRIGRCHTVEQFLTAFEKLRQAADWLINTDLILGLPRRIAYKKFWRLIPTISPCTHSRLNAVQNFKRNFQTKCLPLPTLIYLLMTKFAKCLTPLKKFCAVKIIHRTISIVRDISADKLKISPTVSAAPKVFTTYRL